MEKCKSIPNIYILMSTYNGETYLHEQIDSILSQTNPDFKIYIRDDGSTDSTAAILEAYAKQDERISWYQGANIGASQSFFQLMNTVKDDADYYIFADQDDVWFSDKLERIVAVMGAHDSRIPLLYCGQAVLVNSELKVLRRRAYGKKIIPSFGNALIENICIGCTSAMNTALFQIIRSHVPSFAIMHDWWFYLTASYLGSVIFDQTPLVYYRQHNKNAVGSQATKMEKLVSRIKNHGHKGWLLRQQAAVFRQEYQVTGEKGKLLELMIHYNESLIKKISLVLCRDICRQNGMDDLVFRLLFGLGMI